MIKLYSNRTHGINYFNSDEPLTGLIATMNADDYIMFEYEDDIQHLLQLDSTKYRIMMIDTDITETGIETQSMYHSSEVNVGCGIYLVESVRMLDNVLVIKLRSARRERSYHIRCLSDLYNIEKAFYNDGREEC